MTFRAALAAALTRSHPCVDPSIHDEDAAIILADPAFREALTEALADELGPHMVSGPDDVVEASCNCGEWSESDKQGWRHHAAAAIVAELLPVPAATSVAIPCADPEHDGEHE
jgi:hypothetical protein